MALPQFETGARLLMQRIAAPVATTTALKALATEQRHDGMLAVVTADGSVWAFAASSSAAAADGVLVPTAGSGRWMASGGGGASAGDVRGSVRVATTTTLAANTRTGNVLLANANGALGTIDGATMAVGDRVLVKDEATAANRGIYVIDSLGGASAKFQFTRATDADTSSKVTAGLSVFVSEGTANGNSTWTLTTDDAITLNTTSLTFTLQANLADLASTAASKGASLVGIQDSGTLITATTVEGALAELATRLGAVNKVQIATGTISSGVCTINTGIVVTASTYVIPISTAAITGSTNVGPLAHIKASDTVGIAGVGAVVLNVLGNNGATDTDAAGSLVAIIIN